MADPWATESEPPSPGPADMVVTLVEGAAFVLSERSGDIRPGKPQGLFYRDTRYLSRLELRVGGVAPMPLGAATPDPFSATFVQRVHPTGRRGDADLAVIRRRVVDRGMREEILLRSHSAERVEIEVELALAADFADLFDVKGGRVRARGHQRAESTGARFDLACRADGTLLGCRIRFSTPPRSGPQVATWAVVLEPGQEWTVAYEVIPMIEGSALGPDDGGDVPLTGARPRARLDAWLARMPTIATDWGPLARATRQAAEDLGVLRIVDPEHGDRMVVAAGVPWFLTLFGRDSLLTGWMALLVDTGLPLDVLAALADRQGERVDAATEEEPGRILHEVRQTAAAVRALGGAGVYYGTADATPLFVLLLGEVARWGADPAAVARMVPHADRALAWMEAHGDRDGDGYIEYARATERGLLHQGWKDSWDSTCFSDGHFAEPPIALCEVQAYAYGAYRARAELARAAGERALAAELAGKAAELKRRFNEDFWLPEHGWYAMALDRDKRPVDVLTSNVGHCLWTGIVDDDKAPTLARHLLSGDLFNGWGVRTMSRSTRAYNPMSYHRGSVWPHDSAIVAAGLARYGCVEEAQRIALAVLEAGERSGGRLPELFCGFGREELPDPVPYPTTCAPQAWAAAAPLLLLRTLLRFEPDVPGGTLGLAPAMPPEISRLSITGIPLAGARVDVHVEAGETRVEGLPAGIRLVDRQPGGAGPEEHAPR